MSSLYRLSDFRRKSPSSYWSDDNGWNLRRCSSGEWELHVTCFGERALADAGLTTPIPKLETTTEATRLVEEIVGVAPRWRLQPYWTTDDGDASLWRRDAAGGWRVFCEAAWPEGWSTESYRTRLAAVDALNRRLDVLA